MHTGKYIQKQLAKNLDFRIQIVLIDWDEYPKSILSGQQVKIWDGVKQELLKIH